MKRGILSQGAIICLALIVVVSVLAVGCTTKPAAPTPTSTPTSTPAAAPVSFAGKTVSIIIPSTAGGGTDILGRVYAKYFSKYLPGNPTVVVRNMPGAGGTIGTAYAYNAKPDGLTVQIIGGSPIIAYLMGSSAVKYDFLKTPGVVGVTLSRMFYVKSGIIAKPEDILKAKGLIFGHSTPFSGPGWQFVAANELLKIPFEKVILAYGGSSDSRRAFLSGEINTSLENAITYRESFAPLVEKGEVMLLFQLGIFDKEGNIVRDPDMPPIPTTQEFYEKIYGKSPSGMAWDAYKAALRAQVYDKVLGLAPGTPDNILRAYWDAADKMLKDPEFRQTSKRLQGENAVWYAGEALASAFKQNMAMDPKIVAWFKDLMKTKYGAVID